MSHYWVLLSIFLTVFFLKISSIHSTPINNNNNNNNIDENLDIQRTQNTLNYLIKNILTESNLNEQITLFNQLREYLNRMCIIGYFGSSHARSCQHIVDIVHQFNKNDDENNVTPIHDDNNEQHGLQKRFFCNGFIGCKNAGR
jgi:nucleotidyltransferase/DNA polymerase involved in DNA repair